MSIAEAQTVACPECAAPQAVLLGESVNIQRSPAWRQAVLDGTFHRFACTACGASFTVERDVLYADLLHGVLIGCFSRARRGELASLEEQLVETWVTAVETEAPPAVAAQFEGPGPRVVFGLAELRQKVVCFDAQLDDRLVEAVKLALLEGVPGAAAAGVADLLLVAVDPARGLVFQPVDAAGVAVGPHEVTAPLAMFEDFAATRERVAALLPGLFERLWVHHSLAREGLAAEAAA